MRVTYNAQESSKNGDMRRRIIRRIRKIFQRGGFRLLFISLFWCLGMFAAKLFGSFKLQSRRYKYFLHLYNVTWINERAAEIPIVWQYVKECKKGKILEVGNVLSHYFPVAHTILDKYELGERIINQDVADYAAKDKFDLIVSISTLEHIGFDETEKNGRNISDAIRNLKRLLSPKGKIVVTLPLGYNKEMDEMLKNGELSFSKQYYLQRTSPLDRWKEFAWDGIFEPVCNWPFYIANRLLVGIIENQADSDFV